MRTFAEWTVESRSMCIDIIFFVLGNCRIYAGVDIILGMCVAIECFRQISSAVRFDCLKHRRRRCRLCCIWFPKK